MTKAIFKDRNFVRGFAKIPEGISIKKSIAGIISSSFSKNN
jgi:hypothetical protein